jgi:taurine dioxygenase
VFICAEVAGVDLSEKSSKEIIEEFADAHANYGVLVFADQFMSSDDLQRFGSNLSELSVHPFFIKTEGNPELIIFDNNRRQSTRVYRRLAPDATFRDCPPMGAILYSKVIPSHGGDTNSASMAAIYDGLSDRLQSF